ncbi:hypothetical protein DNTS_026282, partial [Danionella cerebrum]
MDLSPNVIFSDMDSYRISFHSGNHGNTSIELDDDFMPSKNVRPVVPSELSALWEKDKALFRWQSGYEHHDFAFLRSLFISHLQYQLRLRSKHKLYEVASVNREVHVDQSVFQPHTNYTVCVRSQPDGENYVGVWSRWSPVMQSVMSDKVCDVIKEEESLQIDLLAEVSLTLPQPIKCDYENMVMAKDSPRMHHFPNMPYSPVGSEGDSGCWIREFGVEERGSITYSNDYCTFTNS